MRGVYILSDCDISVETLMDSDHEIVSGVVPGVYILYILVGVGSLEKQFPILPLSFGLESSYINLTRRT